MVDWRYMLFAQYPAIFLLSLYFLVRYVFARKLSAVKSILWVLLFGGSLAVAVLFLFLGIHYDYWMLRTLFPLGAASWIGLALIVAVIVARIVHFFEVRHNRIVMEKERKRAERDKEAAVAQARQEAAAEALLSETFDTPAAPPEPTPPPAEPPTEGAAE